MNKDQIRNTFLSFFKERDHKIVSSSPIVIKNDPTLLFTNAGMNQFKDIFLSSKEVDDKRVADTQKCLRVSGKHNDLEEVGFDTYHHTMFEMLGNWSFGDYFKKEAIAWAWELLTEVYKIPKDKLYATIFEGDREDGLNADTETMNFWKEHLPIENILPFGKKDNFWEMGDSGPCGPCSEIHIDLRGDDEISSIPGRDLVNCDHPLVIEIWNLVFIQYDRKKNGILEELPRKHVDTGMGFERLCMVLQKASSTYDTDIFSGLRKKLAQISGVEYESSEKTEIATRVIIDHIRAISFTIADGQLPSNTGAGYVVRRILRRAVRFGFSYLDLKEPFLFHLVDIISEDFKNVFPEVFKQKELIRKVVQEEEQSFLRTLEQGLKRLEEIFNSKRQKVIEGKLAFELYDTYGFPLDLTALIAEERGWKVDESDFNKHMQIQRERSRSAAEVQESDWVILREDDREEFIGYDNLEAEVQICRYREIEAKSKKLFQLVFNFTPFYAESGGQIGDRGWLISGEEKINIIDTIKEHGQHIHIAEKLPSNVKGGFRAVVDRERRKTTMYNHSATHLLHAALKQVLGEHVEQKGSLVAADHLRFDFSHFTRVTDEELTGIEEIVNSRIRENIILEERRNVPFRQAIDEGAMALFGEKYGEVVRVIAFDRNFSMELCGGTHVKATGEIGLFKIISESSIAAGIRRIEALTGAKAFEYCVAAVDELKDIGQLVKNPKNILKGVNSLLEENVVLKKEIEKFRNKQTKQIKDDLVSRIVETGDYNYIVDEVEADADDIKNILFGLNREVENLIAVLGSKTHDKAYLSILISKELVESNKLNAGDWVREWSKEIKGGGGGQLHFASAGGSFPDGLQSALLKARETISGIRL